MSWYEKILKSGQDKDNDFMQNKRVKLINITILYMVPVLITYIFINIKKDLIPLALIDFMSALIFIGTFFYLRKSKNIFFSSLGIFLAVYTISIGILFYAGIANSSFFWIFLIPFSSIFLMGIKNGVRSIYLLLVTIATFYIYSTIVDLNLTYDNKMLLVLILALSLETTYIAFYEKIRQNYEKTIKKQSLTYKTLFDKSSDAILILKDGKFIDCNDATVSMLKYKNKEYLLNTHLSKLSPKYQPDGEESYSKATKMINTALSNGTHRFEWVHTKANGENFWVEVILTPINLNDEEVIYVVWRDIASRKKAESELEKLNKTLEKRVQQELETTIKERKAKEREKRSNQEKSKFLANMSHEIRTPLNAIMGFIGILKDNEQDKEKLKYLNTIDSSGKVLINVINDILDFSKIESGKLEIEKIDFNLKDELNSIIELYYAKSEEKNIVLNAHFDENLPKVINSDPYRLKQVISNLLSNALKFSEDGKEIELNIIKEKDSLKVSVKDNGIGIAKDKQQKIFEGFSQADNSTTRKYGGTGLGLSISSHLIKLLGGELKLESKEGNGSEFYFSIPLKLGKSEIKSHKKVNANGYIKLSGNILLVEDNKANQMLMGLMLKKLSLKYDIANDGLEAIDAFNSKKYDIILMDENMPNLNGSEATKRIREIERKQNLNRTPIFALTANALKGDKERFLDAGMDEYMTKPIEREVFTQLMQDYLMVEVV